MADDDQGQGAPAPDQGSDAPPADPPEQGADGKPFDAERAQATIQKQREREAELDKERKALAKRLADAEARLKAVDDEKLSEQERTAKELADAKAELERHRAERQSLLVQHAVEREAGKLGFADPEDAARFVDLAVVAVDDDGAPQGLARLLKDVLTAKPYLKGTPPPGGVPGTPKPANGDLSDADRRKQAVGIKQLW